MNFYRVYQNHAIAGLQSVDISAESIADAVNKSGFNAEWICAVIENERLGEIAQQESGVFGKLIKDLEKLKSCIQNVQSEAHRALDEVGDIISSFD